MAHDPGRDQSFQKGARSAGREGRIRRGLASMLNEANVVVVATRWPEYADVASAELSGKALFDARRMRHAHDRRRRAIYLSIGRGKV